MIPTPVPTNNVMAQAPTIASKSGAVCPFPAGCSGFHPSFGLFAFSQRGFGTILV
jgi:hypothetical protein